MAKRGTAQHIIDKCKKDPETGCFIWTGAVDKDGYCKGTYVLPDGKKIWNTARALLIRLGVDIEGKIIKRTCHDPRCLNPKHMKLIEPSKLRDYTMKDTRQARGEMMANAFLSDEDYLQMVQDAASGSYTYRELAEIYGYGSGSAAWNAVHVARKYLREGDE